MNKEIIINPLDVEYIVNIEYAYIKPEVLFTMYCPEPTLWEKVTSFATGALKFMVIASAFLGLLVIAPQIAAMFAGVYLAVIVACWF